jgi:oligoribonuclease
VGSAENDRLVWIDCEMTGLDPGLQIVIKASDAAMGNMGDFVRNMHATSGLDAEIPNGLPLAEAEARVLEYVRRFVPVERKAPLAGNTIGTDRMFLAKYMPALDTYLHYRNVDVSSIKELSRRWMPRVYFNAPEKHGGHRALADILESIRELQYYRLAAFSAEPGPSSDEAKALSEKVVNEFTQSI